MLELSQVSLIIPANLCAFLFPCKPVAAHETPFITEHHQNTPGMSPIFSLIKLTIMKILYALQYLPEYLLCKAKAAVSSCSADIKIAIVYNKKKIKKWRIFIFIFIQNMLAISRWNQSYRRCCTKNLLMIALLVSRLLQVTHSLHERNQLVCNCH